MRNKFGTIFMVLGAALLIGALSLFIYNQKEDNEAGQAVAELMPQLVQRIQEEQEQQEQVPDETVILPDDLEIPDAFVDPSTFIMTEVEIDGHNYIGYLSIPVLELELPIMADWDYNKLNIAPCRYTGTVKGEDLVLMAHNYAKHFGKLSQLNEGDLVIFTDMDGDVTNYEVVAQDILMPTAVEEMTSGDFDLTLFTCTYGGRTRVTVYCDKLGS